MSVSFPALGRRKEKGVLLWGITLTFNENLTTRIFLSTCHVQEYMLVIAGCAQRNEAKLLFLIREI